MTFNQWRTLFYTIARLMGDANAIVKGRFLQRLVRKAVLRRTGSFINRKVKW